MQHVLNIICPYLKSPPKIYGSTFEREHFLASENAYLANAALTLLTLNTSGGLLDVKRLAMVINGAND